MVILDWTEIISALTTAPVLISILAYFIYKDSKVTNKVIEAVEKINVVTDDLVQICKQLKGETNGKKGD